MTSAASFGLRHQSSDAYKMGQDEDTATQKAVGNELLAVLPKDGLPWYKKAHMLKLHFCVFSLVMFCMSLRLTLQIKGQPTDRPQHLRTDTTAH